MTDDHRIRACAALLASDKDGEVIGAARAMCRLLSKRGVGPADIVGAGLVRSLSTTTSPQPEPVAPWSPWDMRSDPLRPWRNKARKLLQHSDSLNERELPFVRDMAARQDAPTPRQRDWLDNLAARFEQGRAA